MYNVYVYMCNYYCISFCYYSYYIYAYIYNTVYCMHLKGKLLRNDNCTQYLPISRNFCIFHGLSGSTV